MKKRESTNWYSVIKKSYFKKIGYKENEKIALLIMIMVPYMFYAMMLAYGLHVEILFIQLYAYFSICFIMAIIFFITWLDSKNEVVSEENKSLAMKESITIIFPDYNESDLCKALTYIEIIEKKYHETSSYRAGKMIGNIMCFDATLVFEIACAYSWYLAGAISDLSAGIFIALVLMHIMTYEMSKRSIYQPIEDRCIVYMNGGYKKQLIDQKISDEYK